MGGITITLPFPISTNLIWDYGKRGVYKSSIYEKWIDAANAAFLQQKKALQPLKTIEGKFAASLIIDNSKLGKVDLDNHSKCVFDYLQRIEIVRNDKNLYSLSMNWGNVPEGCKVTIIELPE